MLLHQFAVEQRRTLTPPGAPRLRGALVAYALLPNRRRTDRQTTPRSIESANGRHTSSRPPGPLRAHSNAPGGGALQAERKEAARFAFSITSFSVGNISLPQRSPTATRICAFMDFSDAKPCFYRILHTILQHEHSGLVLISHHVQVTYMQSAIFSHHIDS